MHAFDTHVLETLININSQTMCISGVTTAQKYLASLLDKMGMSVTMVPNLEAESADALIATIGNGPYTVCLLGHVDTVAKGGESFPFERKENGTISGAGISDMKGGLAIIIETLKRFLPELGPGLTIKVVISPNEEVGSPGFHQLFRKIGESSDLVMCFEPALEDGSFIGGRNGNRWYELNFSGEKLHSGRAPKGSPNIIHQLFELQQCLAEHIADDDATKFNFTSLSSDHEKFNVTASEINAKMDLRFASLESREEFHKKLLKWQEENESELTIDIADDCPPMANVKGEEVVLDLRHHLEKGEKIKLSCRHCEGASDANYFSTSANIVLDGFGPRGDFFHSRKEYLVESSLGNRTTGLVNFFKKLNQKKALICVEVGQSSETVHT